MPKEKSIEVIIRKINQSRKEVDELKKQLVNIQHQNDQLKQQLAGLDASQIKKLHEENKALQEELKLLKSNLPAEQDIAAENTKVEDENIVKEEFEVPFSTVKTEFDNLSEAEAEKTRKKEKKKKKKKAKKEGRKEKKKKKKSGKKSSKDDDFQEYTLK